MMARIAVELGSRTDPEAREVLTRSLADLGVALGRGWSGPSRPGAPGAPAAPAARVRRRRERQAAGSGDAAAVGSEPTGGDPPDDPARRQGGHPGSALAGAVRGDLAGLPGVVPAGGRPGAARTSTPPGPGWPGTCRSSSATWETPGGAGGRRRDGGPDADPVGPAAVPAGVLPGRRGRPGAAAGAQLRLQPGPVRAGRVLQRLHRTQGDRDQRLPVGAARRHERGRARGVARLRRPARFGPGVRDPAGRPVPAGGRRDGAGGACRAGPRAGGDGLQPDDDRRVRRGVHGLRRARGARRSTPRLLSRPTTGDAHPSTRTTRAGSAASSASGTWSSCSQVRSSRTTWSTPSCAHPCTAPEYAQGFGTLYTAAYRPAEGRVDYRWPGQSWTRTFDAPDDTTQVVLRQS